MMGRYLVCCSVREGYSITAKTEYFGKILFAIHSTVFMTYFWGAIKREVILSKIKTVKEEYFLRKEPSILSEYTWCSYEL